MVASVNPFTYLPERLLQFSIRIECYGIDGAGYREYTVPVIDAYHKDDCIIFHGKRVELFSFTEINKLVLIDNYGNEIKTKSINKTAYSSDSLKATFVLKRKKK